jgi:hypothetical protein
MSDDIVAELDRWLRPPQGEPALYKMLQRARDEIVALRKRWLGESLKRYHEGRAEERERCAQIADNYRAVYKRLPQETPCQEIAAAIRKEPS